MLEPVSGKGHLSAQVSRIYFLQISLSVVM